MTVQDATGQATLDRRYSDERAAPIPWADVERHLAEAEVSWISTVRPDGRPHVTPLITVWRDDALHFCTGPDEQKAANLAGNAQVVLTTGCDRLDEGLDVVVEGEAVRVTDRATLRGLADAWVAKYGEGWRFDIGNEAFTHDEGGEAYVFAVAPAVVFAFAKDPHGQTRWRFA